MKQRRIYQCAFPNKKSAELLFRNRYRIKSMRLPYWDYGSDGYYFITIYTKDGECVFGDVKNGIMGLSDIGCIAYEQWKLTGELRDNVILDEFIVMPNRVYGVVQIYNQFGPQCNNLTSIVRGFKSSVKRICNKHDIPFQWQARFYEQVVRNEKELNKIRTYIKYNPWKWSAGLCESADSTEELD